MTMSDLARLQRLEVENLDLRRENAKLREQLDAEMEPFELDVPWSNGRVDHETGAARGHIVRLPRSGA